MRVLGVVRETICDETPLLKDEKQGYGGNEMLEEVEHEYEAGISYR